MTLNLLRWPFWAYLWLWEMEDRPYTLSFPEILPVQVAEYLIGGIEVLGFHLESCSPFPRRPSLLVLIDFVPGVTQGKSARPLLSLMEMPK